MEEGASYVLLGNLFPDGLTPPEWMEEKGAVGTRGINSPDSGVEARLFWCKDKKNRSTRRESVINYLIKNKGMGREDSETLLRLMTEYKKISLESKRKHAYYYLGPNNILVRAYQNMRCLFS